MVDGIITKTNGRNKVIDFRDGLIPANVDDYANMHGAGGRKGKAPISVIKLYICDYAKGTGENSLTVNASISPELCEQLLEICKQNIGVQVIDPSLPILADQRSVNKKLTKAADMNYGVLNNVLSLLNRIVKSDEEGKGIPTLTAIASGASTLLTKTRDKVAAQEATQTLTPITIARHTDFTYVQDRVHAFGADIKEGAIVPVQRLNIFHQTFRNDGQASNYPWTLKITNAKAPVHFQATGATTFSSSNMTDKQEAFIQVSDADMYRMMSRVCHFIQIWEQTVAAEVVRTGKEKRETERKAYAAQQETKAG